jgi:hypothetical protein
MSTWGLVTTVKAPKKAVLDFAAWHLDLGAHRLFIHLDEADDDTFAALKTHPRIRPMITDARYWSDKGRNRPDKVEPRQTFNATRTYRKRADVDWLAHIDVDEFLIPEAPPDRLLSALPTECKVARMRPMEALSPVTEGEEFMNFKTLTLDLKERRRLAAEVWPTFGPFLNGGFLSHVAGKIFVRTGQPDGTFRIHRFFSGDQEDPGQQELPSITLAHLHAKSWPDWIGQFRFRHEHGAYGPDMKPNRPREQGGMTMHELFHTLEAEGGEAGLRLFFDEVCAATPGHLQRLAKAGLLRRVKLPLDRVREKHFPGLCA